MPCKIRFLRETVESKKHHKKLADETAYTLPEGSKLGQDTALSSLGTIYSHISTGQSTNYIADYSQISADVDEEVHRLQDYLEA